MSYGKRARKSKVFLYFAFSGVKLMKVKSIKVYIAIRLVYIAIRLM